MQHFFILFFGFSELDKVKHDNAKLKREVGLLTMAVAARNLTPSDVDDWLRRLPNIDVSQLGSTTRQQDQPLPRGKGE